MKSYSTEMDLRNYEYDEIKALCLLPATMDLQALHERHLALQDTLATLLDAIGVMRAAIDLYHTELKEFGVATNTHDWLKACLRAKNTKIVQVDQIKTALRYCQARIQQEFRRENIANTKAVTQIKAENIAREAERQQAGQAARQARQEAHQSTLAEAMQRAIVERGDPQAFARNVRADAEKERCLERIFIKLSKLEIPKERWLSLWREAETMYAEQQAS